ncbi:MAG: aldehyde dehydrogenase family protein, partial [Solirubrobacteraceae bacterium]
AITPWNDPVLTPSRKLAPALLAGNTVVLKPSELATHAAGELVAVLVASGIGAGVVNFVTGRVEQVASTLVDDPRFAAISFTGSTPVGLALQHQTAGRNIRLQTEMGGKNAALILDDANLDLAVSSVTSAAFAQAGQRCTATSRLLIEKAVYEETIALLVARTQSIAVGPGTDPNVSMGPLVSAAQLASVERAIVRALDDGCEVLCGSPASLANLEEGYFVAPTVLGGATPDMAIWREEVFGPVLTCTPVRDLAHGIELVNDSPYGMSCSLFTRSLGHARRFVDMVECGQVAVNLPTSGWAAHQPFGGFKLSGSAHKEQGVEGLAFYTRTKTVATSLP